MLLSTTIRTSEDVPYTMTMFRASDIHKYVLSFESQSYFVHKTERHEFDRFEDCFDHYSRNLHYYTGKRAEPLTEEQFLLLKPHTLIA